jgi:hypothetical protein
MKLIPFSNRLFKQYCIISIIKEGGMSFERALIAQAQPYVVAARARNIIKNEIRKGCRPDISPLHNQASEWL